MTDPLAATRQLDLPEERRLTAVDQAWADAEAGVIEKPRVRDEFKKNIFLVSTGDSIRMRMVEKLLADTDAEGQKDTMNFLRLRLPTERSREIVGLVAREAAQRGWVEMTPALVRRYAVKQREPMDAERPERAALLALHPGKAIEEIVYEVFVGAATRPASEAAGADRPKVAASGKPEPIGAGRVGGRSLLEEKTQSDAWELLVRLDKDGSRRAALLANDARVTGAGGQDAILADLRAAAADLRVVPVTGPELDWVKMLRSSGNPLNAQWWGAAKEAIAGLTAEQAQGLELRHAEAVRWAKAHRAEWLGQTREQLREELSGRLRSRKTYARGADRTDLTDTPPETIPGWDPKLSWGDLLTILVLDAALADARVRAAVFDQANEDRANKQSEYGGALESVWVQGDPRKGSVSASAEGLFEARLYLPPVPPRLAPGGPGDTRFVASDQMISASARALAHYHFHVQNEHNESYAGPSTGDIDYAESYARNCLVFTSIKEGVLNVDYYQRNGARIDLGELRR